MLRYLPFLLLPFQLAAQSSGTIAERIQRSSADGARFQPTVLFQPVAASPATNALWDAACSNASVLSYNRDAARSLIAAKPERIALSVPGDGITRILHLERVEITAPGFVVRTSSGETIAGVPMGLHYRGMVRGDASSVVAISIFPEELMGLIGEASGDVVLGRIEDDTEGRHILYREEDLRGSPNASCATVDDGAPYDLEEMRPRAGAKTIRCVNLYWESAYEIFVNKGSVANVTTYLTGLFNQMATLFANDNVQVQMSELYIWTTTSPYNGTSSSTRLSQFGTVRTSFNGDLAHLVDYANYGGVAWLNTLCAGTSSRMAYSGIDASYNNVPTYSWSVMVVAHETGHNLGSRHTHDCVWNGNNTAIDGCGPAAGYSGGSCPAAPVPPPAVGGTIMSYCHLVSAGINLNNGFGPQPKAVIMSRVNSASCLANCGTSCDAPEPLGTNNLFATSANLTWASFGVPSYTLQWRLSPNGSWTTISGLTTNSYALTGLTQSTAYDFRVLSVCASSSSAYSAIYTFTTPVPCPDALEPNNSTGAAAPVTLPATVNALIAVNGDADYYSFTLTGTSTVNIFMGSLPADYDVRLLNSGGTQIAVSAAGGTSSESINYANAPAGTYYVHVFGYNGAFNTTQCYYLYISSYVACQVPQGLGVTGITYNSGNVAWSALPGASGYDLRWKLTSSGTWTNVTGLATNSYALIGLSQLTSYDVQVRAVCTAGTQGGGATSDYTSTSTFVTLQAPCEVIPYTVVSPRVFLDGAYRTANGLMVDSLRALGQLPLTEPYTALGHTVSGPTTTTAGVFATTGNNAPVDWVLIELRENSAPHAVQEARVGLVQRDGDIVAPDGSSPLGFCETPGTYRVSVRHRNHFGCMTGSGVALNGTATVVDFTLSGTTTYGTNAQRIVGSVRALWSGNVVVDDILMYIGFGNDRDPILLAIGGTIPTNVVPGNYAIADVNMDGQIKYVGQDNDRDPILSNVGGSVPTNTMVEQLP